MPRMPVPVLAWLLRVARALAAWIVALTSPPRIPSAVISVPPGTTVTATPTTPRVTVPPSLLPSQLPRKHLVLDLDETLVHSTSTWASGYHFTVSFQPPVPSDGPAQPEPRGQGQAQAQAQGPPAVYYVTKRPHVDAFLKKCAQWYELSVFTCSVHEYASQVLDKLDRRRLIKNRYYRDSCKKDESGQLFKALRECVHEDLSKVILVDNTEVLGDDICENWVPVPSWSGEDPHDDALLDLVPLLFALRFVGDVRSILGLRTRFSRR